MRPLGLHAWEQRRQALCDECPHVSRRRRRSCRRWRRARETNRICPCFSDNFLLFYLELVFWLAFCCTFFFFSFPFLLLLDLSPPWFFLACLLPSTTSPRCDSDSLSNRVCSSLVAFACAFSSLLAFCSCCRVFFAAIPSLAATKYQGWLFFVSSMFFFSKLFSLSLSNLSVCRPPFGPCCVVGGILVAFCCVFCRLLSA